MPRLIPPTLAGLALSLCFAVPGFAAVKEQDPNIRISLLAFENLVDEAARLAEADMLQGRKMAAAQLREINLTISSKMLRLWIDAVPALEANVDPPREHEPIFPPALAE